MRFKSLVKPLVPRAIVDLWRASVASRIDQGFSGQSPAQVFSDVYRRKLWDAQRGAHDFCSGTGSHDEPLVRPYVSAVREFLQSFPRKPAVVDLGCGDFNVGAQIRSACGGYTACDVVSELIDHNRRTFGHLDVQFTSVDIVSDDLPPGDVALLRQVLQHLSNAQIAEVLNKCRQYTWLVLTEHLPRIANFTPNIDKPIGPGIRLRFRSGVVITRPPFDVRPLEQRILCAVVEATGIIRTIAYRLRA